MAMSEAAGASAGHDAVAPAGGNPRVYTVPPGAPFLETLAQAVLKGALPHAGRAKPDVLDLPDITLILPTRRATRAVQDAFLKAADGRAVLLPRILPISEGEDDLTFLTHAARGTWGAPDAALEAQAIDDIERQLMLTRLVLDWSAHRAKQRGAGDFLSQDAVALGAATPAQAGRLAQDLARLMDIVETENKSLDGLSELVPQDFSEHWQDTLTFLKILTEAWPEKLAQTNLVSAVVRRNQAILAEAERMRVVPPASPVIVAGVTGSIPATKELMRVVSRLPAGAVVVPGLDVSLDEESWQAITPVSAAGEQAFSGRGHPEHPQFGLKLLLDGLGVTRSDVGVIEPEASRPAATARQRLISEALRPASTIGKWQTFAKEAEPPTLRSALSNVSLIEAKTAQDEAEAVALILRHAAETPRFKAALVSPDRVLARRVAIRLEAWGIRVDDSAGRPFVKTVPGTFLDLVVDAVANDFAPGDVMALLKHPLARLGLDPFSIRRAARNLEIAAFRTSYLSSGLDGIERAVDRAAHGVSTGQRQSRAVQRLQEDDWAGIRDLVARLHDAFDDLADMFASPGRVSFRALAEAHLKAAEAVARVSDDRDASEEASARDEGSVAISPLWQGEAGDEASTFFAKLLNTDAAALEVTAQDYSELYRGLLVGRNVRPRGAVHPRLSIWGPFESRLQQPDIIVLGSLNDGVWPEAADPGPWLNRSMRRQIGLPSPEEDIGRSALDFSMLMNCDTVYLTRAEKVGGNPAVPSRWLMRLQALLDGLGARDLLKPDEPWSAWASARNVTARSTPISAPAPRPPVSARPRRMSVSGIERWIANPYSIFARDILRLEPFDPLGKEPGADLRGSLLHLALARFAKDHPETLPDNSVERLVESAEAILSEYDAHPRIKAFWLPRMRRFAEWFADSEHDRRDGVSRVVAETTGQLVIAAPAGPFTLTARADRIDVASDGIVITDYKTGTIPKDKHVREGRSPQLTLEAAIQFKGEGFALCDKASPVRALRYIQASGGTPPGEEHVVAVGNVSDAAEQAYRGLEKLVAEFDRQETPYQALRRPSFDYRFDDFDHLARVGEWSVGDGDGGEE